MMIKEISILYKEIIEIIRSVQLESKFNKCIYTCIIGNFDNLVFEDLKEAEFDIFVITDTEVENVPEYVKILRISSLYRSKRRTNRVFKILPHLFFSTYKFSIYFDSNLSPNTNVGELFHLIASDNFLCFSHNKRSCVYNEIDECIFWLKDNSDLLKEQRRRISDAGLPKDFGLYQGSVLVRNHNEIRTISEYWHKEYDMGSARDQISLAFSCYMLKFSPRTLDFEIRSNYFSKANHSVNSIHENRLNSVQRFRVSILLLMVRILRYVKSVNFFL